MSLISNYIQHYLTRQLLHEEYYSSTASERRSLLVDVAPVNNLLDQTYIAMSVDERDETFRVIGSVY